VSFTVFSTRNLNALTWTARRNIEQFSPNEMDAIRWLRQADYGYLAEATIPGRVTTQLWAYGHA
jgi:hypothetical protein